VAHLVTEESGCSPADAVAAVLPRLRGTLFTGEDDLLIGARKGSPLAIGYGDGEMYLGSDAIALAPFTDMISYLGDGDWVVLTRNRAEVRDGNGNKVERAVLNLRPRAFSSTNPTIPTSWLRRFMSSRRWSAIRSPTISTRRPNSASSRQPAVRLS
jgi:glucosamine 6-phosphate synthetase-like amidotransferase/phosphosugar isomerase protein